MSNLWITSAGNGKIEPGYSLTDSVNSEKMVNKLSKVREKLLGTGQEIKDSIRYSYLHGSFEHKDDEDDANEIAKWADGLELHPALNDLIQRHTNIAENTSGLEPHEALCRNCAISEPDGPHESFWEDDHTVPVQHPESGKTVNCACWCNNAVNYA